MKKTVKMNVISGRLDEDAKRCIIQQKKHKKVYWTRGFKRNTGNDH